MNKLKLIIWREFWTRIRKRSFWMVSLLTPLGIIALMLVMVFLTEFDNSKSEILVIDEASILDTPMPDSESVFFKKSELGFEENKLILDSENGNAILLIPQNFSLEFPNKYPIQLHSGKPIALGVQQYVKHEVNKKIIEKRIELYGIDKEKYKKVQTEVRVDMHGGPGKSNTEYKSEAAAVIGMIVGFAIYITVFMFGTMLMKGVIEEKQNRIVEVMLSTIKPIQLLLGKIFGIGMVALSQIIIWNVLIMILYVVISPFLLSSVGDSSTMLPAGNAQMIDESEIEGMILAFQDLPLLAIFIGSFIYFLAGYFLYGSMFATIGAATNDDGDLQGLTLLISVPVMLSLLILTMVLENPNSSLAMFGSMFPLTSPIVMPALLPYGVPWWHILISLLLLVLTIFGTAFVSAKIYRTGILLYGKKITLKEIIKWGFTRS